MNTQLIFKSVKIISAGALFFQTLEYLYLKNLFLETGVWRWSEIRSEHYYLPYFDLFLKDKNFTILLYMRLFFSILALFFSSSLIIGVLFFSSFLISIRFRGSFNGGSDYMSQIVLITLFISSLSNKLLPAALFYIAFQTCSSYFLAGLVKIKQSNWRTGKALQVFSLSANYSPPLIFKNFLSNKKNSYILSWGVMIFELGFPLIFFTTGHGTLLCLALAFFFHSMNTYLFGLNRFLFIWSATYPALYYAVNSIKN